MNAEHEASPLDALRRERIAACLIESMPTEAEIERARRRRRRRAAPHRQTRALVAALVYGVVLGLASAAAASLVADHLVVSGAPDADRPRLLRSAAAARVISLPSARRTAPRAPEPVAPAVTEPRPRPPVAAQPSAQRAPLPPAPASAPESVAAFATGAAARSGPWERAAKALAAGDFGSAEAALSELDRSDDAHARDAAALARAQLRITQGRGAEVRPALERLARSGATPLIRRRAAALLDGL